MKKLLIFAFLTLIVMSCNDDEPLVEVDDKAKLEAIKKAVIGKWMLTSVTLESKIPSGQITEDSIDFVIPRLEAIKVYKEGYIFDPDGSAIKLISGGVMEHWRYEVIQKKENYFIVVVTNGDQLEVSSDSGDVDGFVSLSIREMHINSFFYLIHFFEKTIE